MQTCSFCKKSLKNFTRDSVIDAKKKVFRPIRIIDFFGTNYVYTLNGQGNIPPECSTAVA